MSPAPNRGSSAAIGDSHMHSQGTPAPAGMFGPSTPAPMTPHTPASADPGIVPQLQ
jgi:transcription initiation factor TFIID TATA-box-binding protein